MNIKKVTFLLALFCLMSCSDNDSDEKGTTPPDNETVEVELFRANRIFIKHGLQLQCWVATDNFDLGGKAGQPAYVMNPDDWKLTGFTAPTFYGPPLINTSYFEKFPNSQWAISKAPYGEHLNRAPNDVEKKEGFLSADQKARLDKLITICFGDEENYNYQNVKDLKEWYNIARKFYPDALVHNNQFANQWSESQLTSYINSAKPDLITYDWYYFHSWDANDYIGAKDMATHLKIYRDLSLKGLNGDGKDYLAFGQYTQGFTNEGTYKLTESQLRLYYYMTWTFGGKWLNWFRYLQGDGYGGQTSPTEWALLLEQGMPGQPSKYMDWVNRCNRESKYISDYLVRLKTSGIYYIAGSSKYTEGTPDNVSRFSTNTSFIKKIEASCTSEPDQSADMYIGFFDIIPQEEQGDPTFFKDKDAKFFMVTNGLASKMEETAEPLSQNVYLEIDFSGIGINRAMFWVNPKNGKKEELKGETIEEAKRSFEVKLEGGSGALFIIE